MKKKKKNIFCLQLIDYIFSSPLCDLVMSGAIFKSSPQSKNNCNHNNATNDNAIPCEQSKEFDASLMIPQLIPQLKADIKKENVATQRKRMSKLVVQLSQFDSCKCDRGARVVGKINRSGNLGYLAFAVSRHQGKYVIAWNFEGGCSQSVEGKRNLDLDDVLTWLEEQESNANHILPIEIEGLGKSVFHIFHIFQ